MDLKHVLHKASHLKWLFLLISVVLIVYTLAVRPNNLLYLTGLIIFFTGIQLGFDSLADVGNMSQKEKERYKTTDYARFQFRIILFSISLLILISILFMSLKFIFPSQNTQLFQTFFDLGLNCWALILGLICQIKTISDKQTFVQSQRPSSLDGNQ